MRRENHYIWLGKGLVWRTSKDNVCDGDFAEALFIHLHAPKTGWRIG